MGYKLLEMAVWKMVSYKVRKEIGKNEVGKLN